MEATLEELRRISNCPEGATFSQLGLRKSVGAYPSLEIGPLLDSHKHDIGAIMHESLETEGKALLIYRELLSCVQGRSVVLEEYARRMIYAEELHASEVDKMLRKPGEVAAFQHA